MNLFRKRKPLEERRLPQNAELRRHFDAEQKVQTQETLSSAQATSARNDARIERIRALARIVNKRAQ